MKSRKHEIILVVLTIATVIVTVIGVTFAYFTAKMNTTGEPVINVGSANVGVIKFDGGADFKTATNIEPSWKETKTFTITSSASDATRPIKIKLMYTNTMPGLVASVTSETEGSGAVGEIELDSSGEQKDIVIVDKSFPPSESETVITYSLTMELPETSVNQNESQGKKFDGTLYVDTTGSTLYYNDTYKEGTTKLP